MRLCGTSALIAQEGGPLFKALSDLFACFSVSVPTEGRVVFESAQVGHVIIRGEIMSVKLPVGTQSTLRIRPVDALGNPALVDGAPTWDQSGHFDLMPGEDGMSAVVRPHGALGNGQVSVTCDADMGAGVRPINGVLDIEVVAGEAVGVSIEMGPVQPVTMP